MSLKRPITYKKIQRLCLIGIVCLTGFAGAMQGGKAGGDLVLQPSLEAARQDAKRLNRPLLLIFSSPGCGWCKKMDVETFTDPTTLFATKSYLVVRVDSSTDENVFRLYGVSETPTCLFLDPQGKETRRMSGFLSSSTFLSLLKDAGKNAQLPAGKRPRYSTLPLFFP